MKTNHSLSVTTITIITLTYTCMYTLTMNKTKTLPPSSRKHTYTYMSIRSASRNFSSSYGPPSTSHGYKTINTATKTCAPLELPSTSVRSSILLRNTNTATRTFTSHRELPVPPLIDSVCPQNYLHSHPGLEFVQRTAQTFRTPTDPAKQPLTTDNLDWGQHVSDILCKATKKMCFLRCNLALAPRHTKEVANKILVRPHLEYAAPIWHPYHETQIAQVEKVKRTAVRWTCRRWRNTSSVGDMLDALEWPSLETCREQSSLTFFYKIHSGTVSLDKDKYLTLPPNRRRTRASHESQCTRYLAYSEALKNSFFPRTIPVWNSLPSSVVSSKTPEEFKALI